MSGVRLNILTPRRFVYVALTPEGRVQGKDKKWHWIEVRPVVVNAGGGTSG